MAVCVCECGGSKTVFADNLTGGKTVSCGCHRNERTRETRGTHGLAGTPLYRAWTGMMQRCYSSKHKHYSYYGGAGVTVCHRWHDVESFLADMGHPDPGMTLDRKDSAGNYEPGNCRWATRTTQARNTRVRKTSKSRVKGVHWVKRANLWYSQILVQDKAYGGYSKTLLDAVALRYRLEREHWKEEFDTHETK